eukprot:TRINITY_DN31012_c0_g2_i2.p1 TRINITY_DN31012_c0_g2~~TRINITY_DN31012_c0_g2_i2.p1  ORF type:complete len:195 (-),score=75.57 TRINITY_DN31012_c0_g2_i2:50-634(-)
MLFFFFFFKQKTAYEMLRSLVGSEMCIRDRYQRRVRESCTSSMASDYGDYGIEGERIVPQLSSQATWRCTSGMQFDFGFELTQDQPDQTGHVLCLSPFQLEGIQRLRVGLEYTMGPNMSYGTGGEGLCIYLADPNVPGCFTDFSGQGPLGFVGKPGALLGVGIDLSLIHISEPTRLLSISYAVFCLKKKKKNNI